MTRHCPYGLVALVVLLLVPLAGCRLCQDCEDIAYPTYGGAWQRTIRDSGRVGSLFDPAGARASELVARDSTISQDELERSRQEPNPKRPDELDDLDSEDSDSADEQSPDDNDSNESDPESLDPDVKEKMEELRNEELGESGELEEARVMPGETAPPMLR